MDLVCRSALEQSELSLWSGLEAVIGQKNCNPLSLFSKSYDDLLPLLHLFQYLRKPGFQFSHSYFHKGLLFSVTYLLLVKLSRSSSACRGVALLRIPDPFLTFSPFRPAPPRASRRLDEFAFFHHVSRDFILLPCPVFRLHRLLPYQGFHNPSPPPSPLLFCRRRQDKTLCNTIIFLGRYF